MVLLFWPGFGLHIAHADPSPFATGITEPVLDVTLSAPVAGIVSARRFPEGAFVEKGQEVVELDKKLEEFEAVRRKVIMERSKTDFEATRTLYQNSKSVSQEELDKRETEYKVASADYDIAAEQLRKRQIVSPLSGFIVEIFREVGEAVQANEKLVRIVETRRGYFVCNLEAKAGHGLQLNQPIKLEIEAADASVALEGKISYLSPVVDPASGLLKVKVLFDNTGGKIRPGVAGRMYLTTQADGK
jgi:RND family efflux transporter MFP subunit